MVEIKSRSVLFFTMLLFGCQQILQPRFTVIQLEPINEPSSGIVSATGTLYNSFPFDICIHDRSIFENILSPIRVSDLSLGLVVYSDPDELTVTSSRPFLLDYAFSRVPSGATLEVKGQVDLRDFYALKKTDGTILRPPPSDYYGFEMTLSAIPCNDVQIYVDLDTDIEMIKGNTALNANFIWLTSSVTGKVFIDPQKWSSN